jgi:hypothetical protein
MGETFDLGIRRHNRTAQRLRRVGTLASELAKFSPDFVDDFPRRMIADAGPHDGVRRDVADFAEEPRNAISEHRKSHTGEPSEMPTRDYLVNATMLGFPAGKNPDSRFWG